MCVFCKEVMFCVFVVFSLCLIGEWSVSRICVLFFSSVWFVCSFFCYLYWGCIWIGCYGCLVLFCEFNLGDKCLDGVLNNNSYELDILKNYLVIRGLIWKNMLIESFMVF